MKQIIKCLYNKKWLKFNNFYKNRNNKLKFFLYLLYIFT